MGKELGTSSNGANRSGSDHLPAGQIGFPDFGFVSKVQNTDVRGKLDLQVGPEEEAPMLPDYFRKVSLKLLNSIVQSRDDYGDIGSLARGIRKERMLIHNPLVAQFDEEGARKYLTFAYGLYGDKVRERKKISDLAFKTEKGEKIYYIVISGHRRLRALEINGGKRVMVKVVKDIDPLHALYLQAQENTAKPLSDDERAEQHGRLWRVSKALNPKLTLREFSSSVGTAAEKVRKDLRYFNLPEEVKKYVVSHTRDQDQEDGLNPRRYFMPFNVACQIGRLVEEHADLPDILFIARRFFEEGVSSEKTASERISKYIRDSIKGKTDDMRDMFGVNMARIARMKRRSQIEKRFVGPVDDALAFFKRVAEAQDRGLMDPAEDASSLIVAATRLESLAEVMGKLLPLLDKRIKSDPDLIRQVIEEMRDVAIDMGQNFGPSTESPREHVLTEGIPSPVSGQNEE